MCYLPITWQSRRNVFEHDKDTSFEIAPLVPSKRSANQQVLGRSVKPILPPLSPESQNKNNLCTQHVLSL